MKYFIPSLLMIIGLTQCTKNDIPSPQEPISTNIFNVTPDANHLLDTLTFCVRQTNEILYGFIFSYDNLNRVTNIMRYEYFGNIPQYIQGNWTFNYQGNSIQAQSMDQLSDNNYRVYFFYNEDGSKNRDSIVSSDDPTLRAVRKYQYDSAFNFVVAKHYVNGSIKHTLEDSASFKNYNCDYISSIKIQWSGSIPYTDTRFHNFYPYTDNKPNPFSKLNIFPAMFLAPYLQFGYSVSGERWRGNIITDVAFMYNPRKYWYLHTFSNAYNYISIKTGAGETYDSNNRIVRNYYSDSIGSSYGMDFANNFYANYKYR